MNILFVHYGTFAANSMNHIGPFANELKKQGHGVAITLPELDPSFRFFPYARVPAFSYDEFLENPRRFGDQLPDIVHAWTPREGVRKFCEKLWDHVETKCIIHLEDDEAAIRMDFPGDKTETASRTDPLQGPWFLETADGFTVIIESLASSVSAEKPHHLLYPGFDSKAAEKNPEPRFTRSDFGIPEDFKLITYPGGSSGPNARDLIDLFHAVHLLNEHGSPCLLLKTGFPDPLVRSAIPEGAENWIRDLGYLPRNLLWRLIEMADIVVQPGRLNDYNENRLPSKLPDFLCLGKPVITSSANLGHFLADGAEALLLKTSTGEEIAARCQELFSNPGLAEKIAEAGQNAGLKWFNLNNNTSGLLQFYEKILNTPGPQTPKTPGSQIENAIITLEDELSRVVAPSEKALRIRSYLQGVRKSEKISKPAKGEPTAVQIELQIYFPNQPEKLELSSLRRWYPKKKPLKCVFPFSPPQDLDWIRIDPGQFPGNYILKSWSLLDALQNPVFEWTPESKLALTCQLNGATPGPVNPDGQEIWSLTHDPQLLFAPLPSMDTDKVRWFKIEITAVEVDSPLTQKLTLRPKSTLQEGQNTILRNNRIDFLLETLERRQSPVLRFLDRIRKKIKS